MDKNQPKHERIKIVLFGDSGAGKTSIMHKLTAGPIPKTHMTTIGVEFKTVNVDIEGKIVQLMIWDTAGQERFRTITSTYYRYTQGVVLVFDITNPASFNNIRTWMADIEQNAEGNISKILVGNKCDREAERQVSRENAQKLADSLNINYFEVSALLGTHIEEAFKHLAKLCLLAKDSSNTEQKGLVDISRSHTFKKKRMC